MGTKMMKVSDPSGRPVKAGQTYFQIHIKGLVRCNGDTVKEVDWTKTEFADFVNDKDPSIATLDLDEKDLNKAILVLTQGRERRQRSDIGVSKEVEPEEAPKEKAPPSTPKTKSSSTPKKGGAPIKKV